MLVDYIDFLRDLIIDLAALYLLVYVIYYRRYGDREMAITMGLLNLFLFTIVLTMTMTEFNLGAGFALFALLSLITLRSVIISKVEVGYILGAITLGLVNGMSIHDYLLLALCNLVILVGPWVMDSSWLLKPTLQVDVTLDEVTDIDLKDHARLVERVQALHELPVAHLKIEKFNAKKGTVQLSVRLRLS